MANKEIGIVEYVKSDGAFGSFMFLAYIGAAVYFVQQTNGEFQQVIIALLQAIVWPAYVIFHLLTTLGV